jgi:hypothetical protein
MADSTTPQTAIPTFNLNLEPSADPVSPVISETASPVSVVPEKKDDRLQKEDKLVEEAVIETKPIVIDLPVAPVVVEKPIVEPVKTAIIEPKIETKPVIVETPVPIVESKPIPTKIETPVEQKPSIVAAPVITAKSVIIENKPATVTSDLQKDMQIIQNIQKETNQPPVTTAPTVVNTVAEMPKIPAANSLNLDNIKVDIPKIPAAPQIPGITTPPQITIPQNPYDNLQKIIPQITPMTATPSTHKGFDKAKGISIGVTIGFLILSRFTIKTMYPIQYQDALNSIFGAPEDTGTSISATLSGSEITGDLL